MRFTRAAKVAAFPLLTMVLVVALIACQGPVGDAGKDGGKGDTGEGTPGTDADPALQAKAMNTVIFNSATDNGDTTWAPSVMGANVIDLSTAFTGGVAGDREYRIETVLNTFVGLGYTLKGSMLTVTVTETDGGDAVMPTTQDAVIRVEVVVKADDSDAVANIAVRANVAPVIVNATQGITVGTQTEDNASPDGDYYVMDNIAAMGDTPEDKGDIVCATLNSCTLKVSATDVNVQDMLTWTVHISDDDAKKVDASATNDPKGGRLDGIVTITGLEAGTDVMVRVWAVDEGMRPEQIDDDPATTGVNEFRPVDADVYVIMVTVDGAPTLSPGAIQAVSLDVGQEDEVVGTVYDPEGDMLLPLDITETPERAPGTNVVATVNLEDLTTGNGNRTSSDGQEIHVDGENTGTVTFTVKALEPAATTTTPQQFAKHTFTVIVLQRPPQ